jgi:hypothetical protein
MNCGLAGGTKVMPWLLKGTATAGLLGVILLTGSATANRQADSAPRFPFAYAQYGCAPTDALALDFYFTASQSECGKISEPYVKISIGKNLPKSAPYSVEVRATEVGASRCLRPGACEVATSGSLHLDKFIDEKISAGEFELHFRDGSVEKGKFDATWCHIRFVCG